jgi:hypothetical protein
METKPVCENYVNSIVFLNRSFSWHLVAPLLDHQPTSRDGDYPKRSKSHRLLLGTFAVSYLSLASLVACPAQERLYRLFAPLKAYAESIGFCKISAPGQ